MTSSNSLVRTANHGWLGHFIRVRSLPGGTRGEPDLIVADGQFFVAKKVRLTAASARWQATLLEHLRAEGFNVPEMVPTTSGQFVHNGVVLSRFIEGRGPSGHADWDGVRKYLERMHRLTADWPPRPDTPSVVGFNTGASIAAFEPGFPQETHSPCMQAWAQLQHFPVSVVHGDPNATNVIVTANGVALVDWEEARVDYSALDFAGLPLPEHSPISVRRASMAWEAFICWHDERAYSRRMLGQLNDSP